LPHQTFDPHCTQTHRIRTRSRLSDRDIAERIAAFKVGVQKYVLAERHGISLTSVKRLLRKHGVCGSSTGDRVEQILSVPCLSIRRNGI
jgi:hypothetical protein